MKVLSLFDGMACGYIAMQNAGIKIESYDAYEIDKYAIQTATHNFPQIVERGDVFNADFTQYEGVDFLIGGSPCTYWSIAQTKNRETVASGMGWELFSQYVRALREAKPKYFIYENNKSMSKQIKASIDEAFGFDSVLINSALVSAQNRQRLYWVGKRNADGTYSKVNVEQPEDRGILLKDVLDSEVIKDSTVAETIHVGLEDIARLFPKAKENTNRIKEILSEDFCKCDCYELDGDSIRSDGRRIGRIVANDKNKDNDSQQYRVYSTCGKSVTLCGSNGSMGKQTGLYAIPYAIKFDSDGKPIKTIGKNGKEIIIYEVRDGKITIKGKQYPIKLVDGYYIIRKLTVSECKRLQTVPEWYEFPVSDSQAYKMLGNGWTCDVITHLIQSILRKN